MANPPIYMKLDKGCAREPKVQDGIASGLGLSRAVAIHSFFHKYFVLTV
jgi:hypothetical protein